MKFELTKSDQSILDRAVKNNITAKWLANKHNLKFEVGDVLIKLIKKYKTDTWVPENIVSDVKMPQRYVYVFEDEHGIGYIKPLRISDGKLGVDLICLAEIDYDDNKFQVDPEFAEATLLDAEYDIKKLHKNAHQGRKLAAKMNRKIGVKPTTLKEYNKFFETFQVGDTIYTSHDYTASWVDKMVITQIEKVTIQELEKTREWWWDKWKTRNPQGLDDTFLYKFHYQGSYRAESKFILNVGTILYKQEPAKEEKT